jgi:hypothetical protein
MAHLRTLEELHLSTDGATFALRLRLDGGESLDVALTPSQLNALIAAAERLTGPAIWSDPDADSDPWVKGP